MKAIRQTLCLRVILVFLTVAFVHFAQASDTPSQAPTNWVVSFQDDFQEGNVDQWNLESGWTLENDVSNFSLRGVGHGWARITVGSDWADYSLQTHVRLFSPDAGIHLNFRAADNGNRYAIRFDSGGTHLAKEMPVGSGVNVLAEYITPHAIGVWYNVEIIGTGAYLRVYVNGSLDIAYTDSNPITAGRIAFESLAGTNDVDDVVVRTVPPPAPDFRYTWLRSGGPIGGLGYDVRICPTNRAIMFVTDNPSGVNKSTDGGLSWRTCNSGISTRTGPSNDGTPVFCLTVDPNNPDIIWIGTQNAKGIYKSTDGGETWVRHDSGIAESTTISFRNFGINPTNSDNVFVGAEISTTTNGIEFNKTLGKIYCTTNGGVLWNAVWQGNNLVRFILFDKTNPATLYASTGIFDREAMNDIGEGLLKSTNGGAAWFAINNGISNRFAGFLEMHPQNSRILMAAAGNNAWSYPPNNLDGAVYRTTDGGDHWTAVLTNDLYTVVAYSPSNPNIVYAGSGAAFYRSANGGDTWQRFVRLDGAWGPPGVRPGVPISAVVDPTNSDSVFVNNYGGGNFKSTDGAQTWVDASKGYTGAFLHQVTMIPSNPAVVYTIGRSGPFVSTNSALNWTGLANAAANEAEWDTIVCHPTHPGEIIAADECQGVILLSTNSGMTWTEVFRQPLVNAAVTTNRHGFKAIAYAPSNPTILYGGMRVQRNTMTGSFPPSASYGIYKSTNSGSAWLVCTNGLNDSLLNINCLAIHPTNPAVVYAGTWKDGIYKTMNGGANWVRFSDGLGGTDVRALAIDPVTPETVYAGDNQNGAFLSTNAGATWVAMNLGLTTRAITSFAISANGRVLYATTEGEGMFRFTPDFEDDTISRITATPGKIGLDFMSHIGRTYDIEATSNLLSQDWQPVATNLSGIENTLSISNAPPGSQRFYRLKVLIP
jgi:photosystem II stability/assembly factor-like uncharacterized protein